MQVVAEGEVREHSSLETEHLWWRLFQLTVRIGHFQCLRK